MYMHIINIIHVYVRVNEFYKLELEVVVAVIGSPGGPEDGYAPVVHGGPTC